MSDGCGMAGFLKHMEDQRIYNDVNTDPTDTKDVLAAKRSLSASWRWLLTILLSTVSAVCLVSDNEAAADNKWYDGASDCISDCSVCDPCTEFKVSRRDFNDLTSKAQGGKDQVFEDALVREVLEPGGGRRVIIFRPLGLKRVLRERDDIDQPVQDRPRTRPDLEGPIGR